MNKKWKKIYLSICAFAVSAVSFCGVSCKVNVERKETYFQIASKEFVLNVGDKSIIQMIGEGNQNVSFVSENSEIVSVNEVGELVAKNVGMTYVKVSRGTTFEYVKVIVEDMNCTIALNAEQFVLVKGSKQDLSAKIMQNGVQVEGTLTWSISETDDSKYGLITNGSTAVFTAKEVGEYEVTVSNGDVVKTCQIKVIEANSQRLNAPNVTVSGCTKLSWTAVDGAKSYRLMIGASNEWIETQDLTFDATDYCIGENNIADGEELNVYVMSLAGNNYEKLDSFVSTVSISHTYEKQAQSEISCYKEGNMKFVCTACEYSYTDSAYLGEHDYNESTLVCSVCAGEKSAGVLYNYDDNFVPMPTEQEAIDPNSEWSVKYEPYYRHLLLQKWQKLVKDGKYEDQNPDEFTEEEKLLARQQTTLSDNTKLWWFWHNELYIAVFENKDNIPKEERIACYYVSAYIGKSQDTVWVKETYDDGVHGVLDVRYIGSKAFMRSDIKKIICPESVKELYGQCFNFCELETIILPGVTFLPIIAKAYYDVNNFNSCFYLNQVVFGEGITIYGRHFYADASGPNFPKGYTSNCSIFAIGDGSKPVQLRASSTDKKLNLIFNYQIFYQYQPEDLSEYECGKWYFDEEMNAVLPQHDFSDFEICPHCGTQKVHNTMAGIIYQYNEAFDGYVVAGLTNKNKTVVQPASSFNDGMHGVKPVVGIGAKAFENATNLTTAILPTTVTKHGVDSFKGCTNLTYIDARGLKKGVTIYGSMVTNCTNLSAIVVGNGVKFEKAGWNTVNTGKMDIFIDANGETPSLTLVAPDNMTIFSGRIYVYSETEAQGCFYYDETTGKATPYDADSYYVYLSGKVVESWNPVFTYIELNAEKKTCTLSSISYGLECEEKFPDGVVVVPATYNDGTTTYTVTKIAPSAAKGNRYITKVILPETITSYGAECFWNCSNLTYLDIKGLTGNISGIVRNCNKLEKIVVGNNVTFTGAYWATTYETVKATVDIYLNVGDIHSVNLTLPTYSGTNYSVFSGKVYLFSETKKAGCFYFDETTGLATAYDTDSYYVYANGQWTLKTA